MTDDSAAPPPESFDIEARLRHALAEKAEARAVNPADWGAFAGRLASVTRRRQRVLVAVAGLALLIGAAGGYFGDAAASPSPVAARAAGPAATPSTTVPGRSGAAAGSLAAPGVMCPNDAVGSPGATPATTATTVGPDDNGSSAIGSATRLFVRTTTDGVTIRAYQDAGSPASCPGTLAPEAGSGAGSTSPSTSFGTAGPDVTVELSDGDAVGQGAVSAPICASSPEGGNAGSGSGAGAAASGQAGSSPASPPAGADVPTTTPVTTAPPPTLAPAPIIPAPVMTVPVTTTTTTPTTTPTTTTGRPQAIDTGTFGVSEGDPVWWVAVEVDSSVTSVQMTFPDGSTDQMAPVDGVAVLAHRVTPAVASAGTGPYVVRGSLQLLSTTGAVLGTVALPAGQSIPSPAPTPTPQPEPVPLNDGTQAVSPGVIVVCPPTTTVTP
jgi:hypothetical protein